MSNEYSRIKPLAKSVVNRIAAGEIIIAPSNAIKELLENSIDAKSSQIDIQLKDGGLKLLQITDNGSGINKEDMSILCERFTTSKLSTFEDLQAIATYGFRGEALASISHISHLNVITKTDTEQCAWKGTYLDGRLTEDLKPVAGKTGTVIVVEDLFYNVPSRLRALKSYNEEYSKVVDVVSKYSVHTENVGFSCKKQGTTSSDVMIRKGLSRKDRIRNVFGSEVANNLLDIEMEPFEEYGLISCKGSVTNSNYENKKSIQPVFFINQRLVVCDPLRRAINQIYTTYLPKGHRPFIYLSLEIHPKNVDVNVHPTKREVRFLNEDEIIEHIVKSIDSKLCNLDSSRKFLTQQILSEGRQITDQVFGLKRARLDDVNSSAIPKKTKKLSLQQFKKPYEHQMVRTDSNQRTLNTFVKTPNSQSEPQPKYKQTEPQSFLSTEDSITDMNNSSTMPNPVNLSSVKVLRQEVQTRTNNQLTLLFSKHTYVGIADYKRRLMCLQHDVNLYLVDYASICNEFFYQIGLADFSNFGTIEFQNPIDIRELLTDEIYNNEDLMLSYKNVPNLDDLIADVYVTMCDMLEEYFAMKIDISNKDNPKLQSMPLLLKGYLPSWNKLSLFLFKIGAKVNWEDEKECLGGILRQLALFHIPEALNEDLEENTEKKININDCLENLIMPCIKKKYLATNNLVRDVIEIANLPGLYKVFERC